MAENSTLTTRPEETGAATRNGANSSNGSRPTYRPQVDVYETENDFVLVADVPGAGEEDVDLSIEKDVLTLYAKVADAKADGFEPRWRGYGVGDWRRSFRLAEPVDRDGVDATLKDGVLRVRLPKAKESLKKSIPVKRVD